MVHNKWLVLSNTTLGQLMAVIDTNIVIIALPVMGRELPGTSALDLIWVVIGYQLVLSSVLVNFGRLGDIFGKARLYKMGFVVFTAGSALCSVSQSGGELVAFRLMQGMGAALLQGNAAALVADAFPFAERGKALGMNGIAVSTGAVIGLALGGFITGLLGWRAVFWVNIPIGVFGIVWSHFYLKETGTVSRNEKVDIMGNVTFFVALAIFLASITIYALSLLSIVFFVLGLASSAVAFAGFVAIERRVTYPMLKLGLFRVKSFSVANLISFMNSLASGAVLLVLTFYLEGTSMSLSPFLTGVFLLPNAISITLIAPLSGYLSDRFGIHIFTTIGPISMIIGCFFLAQLGPTVTFLGLAAPLLFLGSGMATFIPPNRTEVINSVLPEQRGVASGVYNTFSNTGQTLSRGFAFLIMGLTLSSKEVQLIFSGARGAAGGEAGGAFLTSLHLVFYASTAILAVSVVLALLRLFGVIGARETPRPGHPADRGKGAAETVREPAPAVE